MAANEKFILEFITKGVDGIDRAQAKISDLNNKVNGLATALLGVSFASFIGGALQAADRISDFSDATNISIASLKGLEAAMNAAGGNGRNLEKSINALYAAIETANGGSLQARDAFAKVGVSLGDLKNMSEADILQKTLEGLAQLPAGAERSAIATQLLSRSFRSVDPKSLLAALDPAKYAASEEATKKAAAAQQRLEEKFKSLQEGAINALEPILNLMGETELNAASATKIIQGLGLAFAVLFGAQAIASIGAAVGVLLKLNTALKGTAVAQAILQGLQGPKGWAILAAGAAASAAAIYGINKALEGTDANATAAADAVREVNAAAGVQTGPSGKIVQATPQGGAAGRDQGLDARQKAAMDSNKRIAESNANVRKEIALRNASDLQKINIEAEVALQKAKEDIYSKENLSKAQKDKEYAAAAKAINEKSTSDFIALQKQQQQQVDQIKLGYMDQISQMLGYEKTETQKVNDLIAQQPEKYKEVGEQLRANAAIQDRNLTYIKQITEEQAKYKKLLNDGLTLGINYGHEVTKINLEEERATRLQRAVNSEQRDQINEDINRRLRLGEITKQLLNDEKLRAATLSDFEGDATAEQIALLLDFQEQLRVTTDLEVKLSELRLESAKRVADQQSSFKYGWDDAFKKYAESSADTASQARTYFDTFTNGAEDAMVRFVQTGKLSFKDLANSMIADFARIQAKKIVVGLFGGGAGGGSGLFGNLFSGLFGGGRSAGGSVNMGTPYMVGERGPEMFIPGASGDIVPNNQLGGNAPVMQNLTTVNYSIQAVDASSFRALVARDPQFIYSVTEKGRRSQPTRSR